MKRVIMALGSVASIIGPCFSLNLSVVEKIIVILIGIGCFTYLLIDDILSQRNNEKICKSEKEIKETMQALIKTQGKICIVSRDLSWVDFDIEQAIIKKGENIRIYAEHQIALTKRLESNGVEMRYYGDLGFNPRSRFTIIRYNRETRQVAIANTHNTIQRKHKFKHIIYETGGNNCKQDKWINSLAMDIIDLCEIATAGGHKNVKTDKA